MPGVGLKSRCRCRPEQVDPVVVTRRRRYVLIVERGCHVKDFLAQALECLRMPACFCLPRLDDTVTATSIQSRAFAIESQASGFRRVGTSAPLHHCRHQARLVRGAEVFGFDDLSKF